MRAVAPLPSKVNHEFAEPAYSLLVRALTHNGSRRIGKSIDGIIGARERQPSRWDPTEIARICKVDSEAVRRATPVVSGKTAEVMGQTLSAEHVGMRIRRWCPACMKARPYHRVWWDILPVTSCPEHGIKLTSACGCKRRSLQWRSGPLRHCPAGHALEAVACTEAEPEVLAFDAYVVARLRGDDGERLREFDDVGLGELITICERLGKASFAESSRIYEVRKSYDTGRLHAEGFRIITGQPDAFNNLLVRLQLEEASRKNACKIRRAYGGLYDFVRELPSHSVGSALKSALVEHVRRNLDVRGSTRQHGRMPIVTDGILVTTASSELGIPYERLMDLLDQFAVPRQERGGYLKISEADFVMLKAKLDGFQGLKQVSEALRLPAMEVAGLASTGLLDVIARGKGMAGWIFSPNAAADLLGRLRGMAGKPGLLPQRFVSLPLAARHLGISVAEALPFVLAGAVEVRARWSRRPGLPCLRVDEANLALVIAGADNAGVTIAVAARQLGLTRKTMDAVVASCLLRTRIVGGVRRVPVEEVERFGTAWVTMRDLRRAMGVRAWMPVAVVLERAGVISPMAGSALSERIYPREGAMQACNMAATLPGGAMDGVRDLRDLSSALKLTKLMGRQVIEAGMIGLTECRDADGVEDGDVQRFVERYVTLPELAESFGLSGARAVLSVLDKAGVPATCSRPAFTSYLFPRPEASEALRAWVEEEARLADRLPSEPLLAVPAVAERLGTANTMVLQLVSNGLLTSVRQGRSILVTVSEVERFAERCVFVSELARLAGRTDRHGVGAAFTKVLIRGGVRPVCARPMFKSFVFDRAEAIEAIERLGLS